MAKVIQELTGNVCEPCIAYHHGMTEYFEDDAEALAHVSSHHAEWAELGDMVLSSVEDEPTQHFGHSCIACGNPPYAGTVYDYTLTVSSR